MKKIVLSCFLFVLSLSLYSQSSYVWSCTRDTVLGCSQNCLDLRALIPNIRSISDDYSVAPIRTPSGNCFRPPVDAGLPGASANITTDDVYSQEIALDFDFLFYGIPYASLVVSTNGVISFDVTRAGQFAHYSMLDGGFGLAATGTGPGVDVPDTRYDRALIMGPYADIQPDYTTSPTRLIKYDKIGVAPNRKFVLSFYKIPLFSTACEDLIENTYQITLYEGLGIVDINVYGREKCLTWNQGRAMIGMQNYDRDKGVMPPGRAASTNPLWGSAVMNEGWRFTPKGGPSSFKRVELYDLSGNLIATGDTTSLGDEYLQASFPNICPTTNTTYIVKSFYADLLDPSAEISGSDTINVFKTGTLAAITEEMTPAPCGINQTGTVSISSPVGANIVYSADGTSFQSLNEFNLAPGTYTITAKDQLNGCTVTKTITITSNSTLTATADSTNTSCPVALDGTITVTATAGTPGYTYAIDAPGPYQSSNVFDSLAAGTHTIYVKDNAGCIFSFNETVGSNSGFTTTASSTDASCAGVSNGVITVTQPALGTAPFTYAVPGYINTPQSSNVLAGFSAGTYTVEVKDAQGCTFSFSQPVSNGLGITATFTTVNAACTGVSTGQIITVPALGTSPYTISTDGVTFATLDTLRNLASGLYNITVKDAIGCSVTNPVTVADNPGITATFTTVNSACTGASTGQIITLPSLGISPYTISTDGTTFTTLDTIRNLASGSYSITVKDAVGCTFNNPAVVVADNAGITATFTTVNSACSGASTGQIITVPSLGVAPYTISTDGTTFTTLDTIRNLASGSYSITVKDAVGCTFNNPAVVVADNAGITATFTTVNSACTGASTGQIITVPSLGVAPYTISTDGTTFTTLDTIRNLASGSYSITVRDAVGCTFNNPAVVVADNAGITATFTTVNSACTGASTGQIITVPSLGVAPYTISTDGTTFTTLDTIRNLASGSYSISVKDAVGCTFNNPAVVVADNPGVTATFTAFEASCASASNGQIAITPGTGIAPFQYSKDGGTTFINIDTLRNLTPGSYTLIIKDNVGCTFTSAPIVVGAGAGIAATASTINSACAVASTGQIVITTTAGAAPFQYQFNGAGSFLPLDTIRNLAGGTYTVKLRDDLGCTFDLTGIVVNSNNPGLSATFTTKNSACSGVSTGQIVITPTSGVAPFSYSTDAGTTFPALDTIRNLASGVYNIKVKDALGCIMDAPPVTVGDDPGVAATATTVNAACAVASTGQITVTATAGAAPFQYSIDGGASFVPGDTFTGLLAGTYSIRVKDNVGCTFDVTNITVASNNPGLSATFNSINAACAGVSTGQIVITPTSGVAPFYYSMDAGVTFPALTDTIRNLAAGVYNIKVKDALGCAFDAPAVTVGNNPGVSATATTKNSACAVASTGQIVITPTAGAAPFTYSVAGSAAGFVALDTIRNLAGSTYNVTLKDNLGCTFNLPAITVGSDNPGLSATFATINSACAGVSSGKIVVTPTSGLAPFYTSTDGGTSFVGLDTIRNLAAGTYNIKVKDALGCSFDAPVLTVGNNLGVTANYTLVNSACSGVATGAIIVKPATGAAPFTYSIDGGVTNQLTDSVFRNLRSGPYTVTLKDAVGCVLTSPVQTVQDNPGVLTSASTIQNASCETIPNGSITVNVTAGIAPFTYNIVSIPGFVTQTSNALTGLFSGSYNIQITDSAGCTQTITSVIGNNPKIKIDSVSIVRPTCNGLSNGTLTINASLGVAPYSYALGLGTFGPSKTFNGVAAGAYVVHATDANGCQVDANVTVTEPVILTTSLVSTQKATCSGNPDGQIVVSAAGGTLPYQYTLDAAAVTGYQAAATFPVLAGQYKVTVQDANACKAFVNVTVDSVFNMFLNLGNDTTICAESSIVLSPVTNAETNIFTYTPAASLSDSKVKNPTATPMDTTTYQLAAQYGICKLSDRIKVNVLRKPIANAGADVVICNDTTTTLRGSASNLSGPVKYSWSPANLLDTRADTSVVIARPADDGLTTYTLTVNDDYGCGYAVTDQVVVNMLPPVYAFAGNDTNAVLEMPHQLFATGAGVGGTYQWYYPQQSYPSQWVSFSNTSIADPTVTFLPVTQPGTYRPDTNYYRIAVTATNAAGCSKSDTVKINVFIGPSYYCPNAFSPNNDGKNDKFTAIAVGMASTEFFRIYNRYGQVVFQTNRFMDGWDGTFKGLQQPVGAYVWVIRGKDRFGRQIDKTGTVMLIR